MDDYILEFSDLAKKDAPRVSWRVAMLGELNHQMRSPDFHIPEGFVLTGRVYEEFLYQNQLPRKLKSLLRSLDRNTFSNLAEIGMTARALIKSGEFPYRIQVEIISAFQILKEKIGEEKPLMVKCTATTGGRNNCPPPGCEKIIINTEDEDAVLESFVDCYAASFSDKVIKKMALSGKPIMKNRVTIQVHRLIRSDLACSGTCFTWPPEGEGRSYILLLSDWGLPDYENFDLEKPDYYFAKINRNGEEISVGPVECLLGTKSHALVLQKMDDKIFQQFVKPIPVPEEKQKIFTLEEEEAINLMEWTLKAESIIGEPVTIRWSKDGPGGTIYLDHVEHPEKGNGPTGQWVFRKTADAGW